MTDNFPRQQIASEWIDLDNLSTRITDNGGTAQGVKFVDGKPRVSSMPYTYDIAEGNISGHESWMKIGHNGATGTAEADVWSKTGVYVFPGAAQQMTFFSSDNTNDKAGGNGALTVKIYYLDDAWAEHTEVGTLNGTALVNTVATNIYRVNGFRVESAGTTGKPAGNLSLTNTAGAVTYSYISAGYTRARNSAYTVPAGKTLYVTQATFSFGYAANQTYYARLYTRATQNDGVRTPGIFYPYTEVICANSVAPIHFDVPTKLVEKVDIKVSVIAGFTGAASVSLRGWLET
jgi:hypothetical protein